MIKGIYANRSATAQLLLLALLMLIGFAFSSFLGIGLFQFGDQGSAPLTTQPGPMRILQFISALGIFLLPSLAMGWLCSFDLKKYLFIRRIDDPRIWLLVLFSILLLSPAITLLGMFNQQMNLPDFLQPVENWMRAQEEGAEKLTLLLIGEHPDLLTLFLNLIVIAVTAGLTEEFMFRGVLQRVLEKWTSSPYLVIWSAAFLFSAFHLQFFGFIPRLLLGAYFGYLLYWGKSIWLPVFAHFVNNAVIVISLSDSKIAAQEWVSGEIPPEHLLSFTGLSLLTLLLFIFCARYLKYLLAAPLSQTDKKEI